ncbi:ATP phosphoribosyltransferase [Ruminococcaceae bacterium OttesenSCG-928-A16]|nr:ATP phosphoribosyltransferase [Ruminococcaceae bacterium OttesenSCG-928-A16]
MGFTLPALRREEKVALQLRALFEQKGYALYRMGSFEEYDLYMQNKPFLAGEDIITFTGVDGRLKALKPDVTLSIVKNTQAGEQRRAYYNENVFRRSRQTGEYREINQIGLEFIGGDGRSAEAEVLGLAVQSLSVVGEGALDLSHMGFIEAMLAPLGTGPKRELALQALRDKSAHGMRQAATGLPAKTIHNLVALGTLSGPFVQALQVAKNLALGVPGAVRALDELESLYEKLEKAIAKETPQVAVRLDFSILNDVNYYNGLIFQGYLRGVPRAILSGGRYDNLLHRFDKPQGAMGFALYLDELERPTNGPDTEADLAANNRYLNIALPKGRLGNKVYKMFEQAGCACGGILEESRKLVFEDESNKVRYFLVKPSDVDIYVEHGAADIGVVGKDVLLESGADVLELLDLQLGKCRIAVAGRVGFAEDPALPLRVATKYEQVARRYYAERNREVEIIKLHGSIELAPLLGLSDVIVDIVETGTTLVENNLEVLADIVPSSARLIANRAAWRFKGATIQALAERLGEQL